MVEDFRFWTVARKYAFARTAINVREEIPEAADGRADTSEEAKKAELEAAKKDAKELRAGFDIENQKYNTKKVKRTKTTKGVKKSTQIKLTGLNIFSSAKLKTEASNQTNLKAGKRAEAARQAEKDLQKQKEEQAAKVTADLAAQQMEEKVRSVGAMLVNCEGEAFMNPLETRDVAAASIIRECSERHKGVKTPLGDAVWLDTPMIEIKGGKETAKKFCDNLELFSLLANVADVKSLVIHPASTTHAQLSEEELNEQGIYSNTIRLSIGTENIDDIIEDLEGGFQSV